MAEISNILLQGAQLVGQSIQSQQQLALQRQQLAANIAQAERNLTLEHQKLQIEQETAEIKRQQEEARIKVSERNAAVGEGNLDLARRGEALAKAEQLARTAQLQALAAKYRAEAGPQPGESGGLGTVGGRQAANMLGEFVDAEVSSRTQDLIQIAGEEPIARYGKFTNEQINVQIKAINDSLGGDSTLVLLAADDPTSAAAQEVARLQKQRDALLAVQGARFQLRQQVFSGDRADILEEARSNLNAFVGNDAAAADKLRAAANAAAAAGAGQEPPPLDALNSALKEGVGSAEVAQLDVSLTMDLSRPGNPETVAEVWDGLLRQTSDTADLNAALADLFAYARAMDPGFNVSKYMPVIREIARRRGITRNTSK